MKCTPVQKKKLLSLGGGMTDIFLHTDSIQTKVRHEEADDKPASLHYFSISG